jgi:hypothetical protein
MISRFCIGLAALAALASGAADASSSKGCEGGGFTVLGLAAPKDSSVAIGALTPLFRVQDKYVQFDVEAATLGVRNYMLTGAANPLDMTGGVATPIFESKLPDHRGLVLSAPLDVQLDGETIALSREGASPR